MKSTDDAAPVLPEARPDWSPPLIHADGPRTVLTMNPVGRESAARRRREAADVEAHLVDVLRGTHPVRIGAVLRRMEAEVGARYPAAEAARLLERVIVVAVNSFSASAREVPTVEERVDDPAPGRRGAGRDHVIHHRR